MHWTVKEVEARDDYTLALTFADGERKVFDMKPYLDKGVFRELRDLKMFKTARVCFSSVAWDNEADLDPEALYDLGLSLKD
ncbi:hypothetical protein BH24ACI3_BH24ACI3_17250 [soil metagenome]